MMKLVYFVIGLLCGILMFVLVKVCILLNVYVDLVLCFFCFVMIMLVFCLVGLFVVVEDGFFLLGGEKWIEVGCLLRVLLFVIVV